MKDKKTLKIAENNEKKLLKKEKKNLKYSEKNGRNTYVRTRTNTSKTMRRLCGGKHI